MTGQTPGTDARGNYEITSELSRVGQAEATFERGKATLYRSDGQPKFSPSEHAERLNALRGAFDEVVGGAQETLGDILASKETMLQHLERGDSFDALSLAEKNEASASQVFLKEDALALPALDLLTRCQVALESGHRPTQYLLARYVGQRVSAANKAAHDGQTPEFVYQERQQLADVVTQLTQAVRGPSGALKAEVAREARDNARAAIQKTRRAYDAAHERGNAEEARLLATGLYTRG